ncbi:UDP-forming cellulose synthase catalytic subunit [Paracidobacterium acidisoli]|uniref:Cellulose synthase catalytic subunit [UDP-forming] n=1 Tax=Paracidobacterium acidisoli TaxID=2303751 RepID=A0A372IUN1_9BACT|nr:UDP-forming cellulose synthase catalytic subunit [Paracidobacterium acidisoli]MBT9330118.1 UDP-forming cellulose synthase catalytic subunit [Paracidobacterium acidisoli]
MAQKSIARPPGSEICSAVDGAVKQVLEQWNSLGTRSSLTASVARILVYGILLFLAFECVTINFRWPEQGVLGILTILLAYLIHRISDSEGVTLALMFASMLATARYAWWRIFTVSETIASQGILHIGLVNVGFMLLLLSAEAYAFVVLYLGYIQTIRPLHRPPMPLPKNLEEWPHVDVLIPTYNEPLSVVRSTAFAAMNIDYPEDKLHVYVLDDGRRDEFRRFCEEADIGYITRKDNKHAKAGNINHALKVLDSPYVAIFDCDHVPTRSFLQVTLGWFLKDAKLGMLQTPHFFYSPDPFERNLNQFMVIPNEGELFYGVLQDGNDFWNATFFCGSCAVLRRTALNQVGGIATETVTEDAHTSLRMQMNGWNTAYINIPQAAGLATESLSSHVGQRIRWARGMVQVLRTDNPLFARGLKWPQRLCYFNAMIHFFYAVPRLVFLTAPLVYMLLGHINIPGHWLAILAYAMPHLFLSNITNFRIQGKFRHSFWNEVYETVLAPYILGPTVLALVNPKLGKFNVTAKGGIVNKSYFDSRIARPYVFLILLNVLALLIAPIRFLYWDAGHPGTVAMNVFWILFNMVIIGTANAAAFEARQVRTDVRINLHMPVELRLPDGRVIFGESQDMSLGGSLIRLEEPLIPAQDSRIQVVYPLRRQQAVFPAMIVGSDGLELRIKYAPLSLEEEELLTLVLYSGADTWLSRGEHREPDQPLRSFARLVRLSVRGVGYALGTLIPRRKATGMAAAGARAAMVLFAVLLAGVTALRAQTPQSAPAPAMASGTFHSTFSLKDIGIPESIVFRGVAASRNIPFSLPQTDVAQQATLKLQYAFSPGLIAQLSHLSVFLNGTLVTTIPVPQNTGNIQNELNTTIPLPAELLVRNNVLAFEFVGHYTQQCEDPANTTLWGRVEDTSSIDVSGSLLALGDDLKLLPLPFYDGSVSSASASIPFAFAAAPGRHTLEAAGVIASWFGVLAKSRPLSFPVTVGGTLPRGNVILFVDNPSAMPAGLNIVTAGPIVAVRTNPSDPFGKVLVLAGEDPDQLLTAARAIAMGNAMLQGNTVLISDFQLPPARQADDAPLWLHTDRVSSLWDYSQTAELQSDGSGPLPVYLRVPPDIYYGDMQNLLLHLDYRYNAISLANASTLRVSANGSLANELPLPHQNNPKRTLSYNVEVPLVDMRPFANTFLFNFYFQIAKMGNCQDTPPINLQGAILRSSFLDLRGFKHWAEMPNLELFANAGFPFTRFADLSQTRIVLPAEPDPAETGLYLALLAYFGEQTGYPALRVTVADPTGLAANADYLVIGTPGDQPAFAQLNQHLPVAIKEDGLSIKDTGGIFSAIRHAWWQVAQMRPNWWWRMDESKERDGLLESIGQFPDALLEGIESPWSSSRSVVTITLRSPDSAAPFAAAFWKSSMSGDIGQSVSVLHGSEFSSYRLGDKVYHVGRLPWWSYVRYCLRAFPWLIVVLTFVLGLFIVPWAKMWIDRRSQARLKAQQI